MKSPVKLPVGGETPVAETDCAPTTPPSQHDKQPGRNDFPLHSRASVLALVIAVVYLTFTISMLYNIAGAVVGHLLLSYTIASKMDSLGVFRAANIGPTFVFTLIGATLVTLPTLLRSTHILFLHRRELMGRRSQIERMRNLVSSERAKFTRMVSAGPLGSFVYRAVAARTTRTVEERRRPGPYTCRHCCIHREDDVEHRDPFSQAIQEEARRGQRAGTEDTGKSWRGRRVPWNCRGLT
ncbi:hypothetical protein C8Q78DRAFT_1036813 [Trametes maxima]|nr:hypothetical protein C8Q78DRAFT_1036813 [Trametes maxima]